MGTSSNLLLSPNIFPLTKVPCEKQTVSGRKLGKREKKNIQHGVHNKAENGGMFHTNFEGKFQGL